MSVRFHLAQYLLGQTPVPLTDLNWEGRRQVSRTGPSELQDFTGRGRRSLTLLVVRMINTTHTVISSKLVKRVGVAIDT